MLSFGSILSQFTTLSLNNSSANQTLGKTQINQQHRYLLQRYFDNERTTTLTTIAPQTLTLATAPAYGDTSATLSSNWTWPSTSQLVVFSDGEQRTCYFTQNSSTITWISSLLGAFFGSISAASTSTNELTYTLNPYVDPSNANSSAFVNGVALAFYGSSLPGGITAGTTYYAGNITSTTFKIYTDSGLTNVVTITSTGTATFSSPFTTTINTMGVQSYKLPANVSKIRNATITVGQLVYTPAPVQSIEDWTKLNALPYNAEIPAYFFVYAGELNFWPIPSNTGDIITINCQIVVPDMTFSDYTTGTINTGSVGSNQITGTNTSWHTTGGYPLNTDLTFMNLYLIITPPGGDGIPYQIQSFQSDTALTLIKPLVYAPNVSGASYTIGQYPLLFPDFHDILIYWALRIYFLSIAKDPVRYQAFDQIYQEKLQQMEFYLANKQVNVDLSANPILANPNLYPFVPPPTNQ